MKKREKKYGIDYYEKFEDFNISIDVNGNWLEEKLIFRFRRNGKEVVLYINDIDINNKNIDVAIADYEKGEVEDYSLILFNEEKIC